MDCCTCNKSGDFRLCEDHFMCSDCFEKRRSADPLPEKPARKECHPGGMCFMRDLRDKVRRMLFITYLKECVVASDRLVFIKYGCPRFTLPDGRTLKTYRHEDEYYISVDDQKLESNPVDVWLFVKPELDRFYLDEAKNCSACCV